MLTAMEYSKWTFCREVFFAYRNVDIGFLQQTAGRVLQKALKPETKWPVKIRYKGVDGDSSCSNRIQTRWLYDEITVRNNWQPCISVYAAYIWGDSDVILYTLINDAML